jgi:predicted acylesterase/phospholipase RssA
MTDATKPRYLKPEQVSYLVFEGGGGKGAAYQGVFRALTEHRLLPRPIRSSHPIRGVAGASAGALTALFVALGYSEAELQEEMKFKFEDFLDNAHPSQLRGVRMRAIDSSGKNAAESYILRWGPAPENGQKWSIPPVPPVAEVFNRRMKQAQDLATAWPIVLLQTLIAGKENVMQLLSLVNPLANSQEKMLALLELFIKSSNYKDLQKNILEMFDKDSRDVIGVYLSRILGQSNRELGIRIYALMYDHGFFPGFALRNYCAEKLKQRLKLESLQAGLDLTFTQFVDKTGCDLVVSGTNITRRRSAYFSEHHTPDFPVAEAIALSMSIPLVFKPVVISYAGQSPNTDNMDYTGLWVDGGLYNNLPIHAFDQKAKNGQNQYEMPLNPRVLAFRLFDGNRPTKDSNLRYPPEVDPSNPDPPSANFCDYVSKLVEAILAPAEEGQLRTTQESWQTISIYAGKLSTLDFSTANAAKRKDGIDDAYAAINKYFLEAKKQNS